jgi:hypothetical protein
VALGYGLGCRSQYPETDNETERDTTARASLCPWSYPVHGRTQSMFEDGMCPGYRPTDRSHIVAAAPTQDTIQKREDFVAPGTDRRGSSCPYAPGSSTLVVLVRDAVGPEGRWTAALLWCATKVCLRSRMNVARGEDRRQTGGDCAEISIYHPEVQAPPGSADVPRRPKLEGKEVMALLELARACLERCPDDKHRR